MDSILLTVLPCLKSWRGCAQSFSDLMWQDLLVLRECLLELEAGTNQWVGGRSKFGEDRCSPLEMGVGKGGCSRCSVAGLGVILGDLVWRSRRRGGTLQLVFLPPYQEWSALVSRFFINCSSTIIADKILCNYCASHLYVK